MPCTYTFLETTSEENISMIEKVLNLLFSKHRWFSGRMLACHAGGPGSIPGRCKIFFFQSGNSVWYVHITCKIIISTCNPSTCLSKGEIIMFRMQHDKHQGKNELHILCLFFIFMCIHVFASFECLFICCTGTKSDLGPNCMIPYMIISPLLLDVDISCKRVKELFRLRHT